MSRLEVTVWAPGGKVRGGTGMSVTSTGQKQDTKAVVGQLEPASWQDREAGAAQRLARQVFHDLGEKRHFSVFTLTPGRAGRR